VLGPVPDYLGRRQLRCVTLAQWIYVTLCES
jgi:hypothetical protein